jgi:hypothetical protein
MTRTGQHSLHGVYQVHAFAGSERVEGIRVQVHGYAVDLQPLTGCGWQAIAPDLPGCAAEATQSGAGPPEAQGGDAHGLAGAARVGWAERDLKPQLRPLAFWR